MIDVERDGVVGPLADVTAEFREHLEAVGYAPRVVELHSRLLADVSAWLASTGRMIGELVAEEYVCDRLTAARPGRITPRSLVPLSKFLIGRGMLGPIPRRPADLDPDVAELLSRFDGYLSDERGLGGGTVAGYVAAVRPFLVGRRGVDGLDLAGIAAADVYRFLVEVCPGKSRGAASVTATAMRSLLGWLFLTGQIDRSLAEVIPRVGSWRLAGLVEPVPADEVDRMLGSCDRTGRTGRRDFAMLLVLSRLGLRAGEVARLGLDDIDWRAGELTVRGKGPKDSRLPLPCDVGAALADYLRHGRPSTAQGRTVFVRVLAPHCGLTNTGVTQAVFAAGQRAGVGTVYAHRLRHTAATRMHTSLG